VLIHLSLPTEITGFKALAGKEVAIELQLQGNSTYTQCLANWESHTCIILAVQHTDDRG
jgi:hypothetical protein